LRLIALDGTRRRRKPSFSSKLKLPDDAPVGQWGRHCYVMRTNKVARSIEEREANDDRAGKHLRQRHGGRYHVRIGIDAEHAVGRHRGIVLRRFNPIRIGGIRTQGELRREHTYTCKQKRARTYPALHANTFVAYDFLPALT
jgi:hypothetical protein